MQRCRARFGRDRQDRDWRVPAAVPSRANTAFNTQANGMRALNPEAVHDIVNPAPPVVEVEPAPVLLRTPRTPGDVASRLGLVIGRRTGDVILPQQWAWHAFHLAYPAIIGRVAASIEVSDPRLPPRVQIALHNATGERFLTTQLRGTNGPYGAEFDELRLEPGDYLLTFFGPSARASGSYANPNTGLFPTGTSIHNPVLDELLSQSISTLESTSIGVPSLQFTSKQPRTCPFPAN